MCVYVCMCVKVAQSCLTLCDPRDCSLPGSSVHGILQARIQEWVAVPFSQGSSQLRYLTQISYIAGRFFTIWATREAHYQLGIPTEYIFINISIFIDMFWTFLSKVLCYYPLLQCLDFRYYSDFCCSVTESYLTLYNHMICSIPSFPALHCLPEFAQTHVHWISDAIQPSHPLLPSSPPALNISQHINLE